MGNGEWGMGNEEWGTDVCGRDVDAGQVDALWYICTCFSNTSNIACIDTVGIFYLILFYLIFVVVVFAFLSFCPESGCVGHPAES